MKKPCRSKKTKNMERGAFYMLRNADGTRNTHELFAEFDLALTAARYNANASAVEVWTCVHLGHGIFSESYVTTAFPYLERQLASATAIEILD